MDAKGLSNFVGKLPSHVRLPISRCRLHGPRNLHGLARILPGSGVGLTHFCSMFWAGGLQSRSASEHVVGTPGCAELSGSRLGWGLRSLCSLASACLALAVLG